MTFCNTRWKQCLCQVKVMRRTISARRKRRSRKSTTEKLLYNNYRLLKRLLSQSWPDGPKNWIKQSREVSEEFTCRSEPFSLLKNNLNHFEFISMIGAMTQGSKETLSKTLNVAFHAANTGIKRSLFHFFQIALIKVTYHRTLVTMSMKSFDCLLTQMHSWTQ